MKKFTILTCLFIILCTNVSVNAADKVKKKILKYNVVNCFHDGLARAYRTNSKGGVKDYGFVNTKGEWKLTNDGNISDFSEGLARDSSTANQRNYINKKGKVIFTLSKELTPGGPGHFSVYGDFHDGRAIVHKGRNSNACGAINKAGELVIPCKYWGISDFSHSYAVAAKDNKMGLIDTNGKVIVPFVYEYGEAVTDGFIFSKNSNFWEIYMKPGWWFYHEISTYDVYDADANLVMTDANGIKDMDNGIIVVHDDNYNYIDSDGIRTGQWKTIDVSGRVVYTAADGMSICNLGEGMYSIGDLEYEQLMNSSGNLIGNKKYAIIGYFSGNYAVVQEAKYDEAKLENSGKYGIIDKTGKEVVPCEYELPYLSDILENIENGYVILIDSKERSVLFTLPDENE